VGCGQAAARGAGAAALARLTAVGKVDSCGQKIAAVGQLPSTVCHSWAMGDGWTVKCGAAVSSVSCPRCGVVPWVQLRCHHLVATPQQPTARRLRGSKTTLLGMAQRCQQQQQSSEQRFSVRREPRAAHWSLPGFSDTFASVIASVIHTLCPTCLSSAAADRFHHQQSRQSRQQEWWQCSRPLQQAGYSAVCSVAPAWFSWSACSIIWSSKQPGWQSVVGA
jgi:hypothetical protein